MARAGDGDGEASMVFFNEAEINKVRKHFKQLRIVDAGEKDAAGAADEKSHSDEARALYKHYAAAYANAVRYTHDIDYAPLKEIGRLIDISAKTCDYRKEFGNLLYSEIGTRVEVEWTFGQRVHRLQVLRIPAGTHFFKGTRYFYDTLLRNFKYMWVGNSRVGAGYANRYQGGLMAYRNSRPLDLLIINKSNIEKLFAASVKDGRMRRAFNMKFGVGIDVVGQMKLIQQYNRWDDMWLYNIKPNLFYTYCKTPQRFRTYGAGYNDRVIADHMHRLFSRADSVIHGWFSDETYTPFNMVSSEELLVFDNGAERLELDKKHPLYWENWLHLIKNKFKVKLPAGFEPRVAFPKGGLNAAMYVTKYAPGGRAASGRGLRVLTHNVCGLESTDARMTRDAVFNVLLERLRVWDPDVAFIQEFDSAYVERLRAGIPDRELHDTPNGGASLRLCALIRRGLGAVVRVSKHAAKGVPLNSLVADLGKTVVGAVRIVGTRLDPGVPYTDRSGGFLNIDGFMTAFKRNSSRRTAHMRTILREDADILAGDLGFLDTDPVFKMLETRFPAAAGYASSVKETDAWGTVSAYALGAVPGARQTARVMHNAAGLKLPVMLSVVLGKPKPKTKHKEKSKSIKKS